MNRNLSTDQFHKVWTVDVDWSTHDDVKAGTIAKGTARVKIAAPTKAQATLRAAQMVGSHRDMVTATRVVTE